MADDFRLLKRALRSFAVAQDDKDAVAQLPPHPGAAKD
jgi:hypothetical protein